MTTALIILFIVMFASAVILTAWFPEVSDLSLFELNRRVANGDLESKRLLAREEALDNVLSLRRAALILLVILIVPISQIIWGWLPGLLISIVAIFGVGIVTKAGLVKNFSNSLVANVESKIFVFARRYKKYISLFRGQDGMNSKKKRLGSREEVAQLIVDSGDALNDEERLLAASSLTFYDRKVATVMTPRNEINSVARKEFLGPLVLDDLHKFGHNQLPVIDNDIDHIVGVLHLDSLLALDEKRSKTAERAMDPKVFYIRNDQSLYEALAVMINTRCRVLIVINTKRQTIGLITLRDIVEALLDHEVSLDGKEYDNLREIAGE